MYVIKYASIEPVWYSGHDAEDSPSFHIRRNYRRTFKHADLDRAFESLDGLTAKRTLGARAEVSQVWRIENGKAVEV
jgi:hypothetical protein